MRRALIGSCMFLWAMLAVVVTPFHRGGLALAIADKNDKNNDKQEKALRKQIDNLQDDLKQARNKIDNLQQTISKMRAGDKKEDAQDDKTIAALRKQIADLQTLEKAPYAHCVVVRLKAGAPAGEVRSFIQDVQTQLANLPTVRGAWCGQRADKVSPDFADKSFSVGIFMAFDNYDGLKRYLDHPQHKAFVEKHLKHWETPVVYDFMGRKP